MLFANLDEELRQGIINIYRHTNSFVWPLTDALNYLSKKHIHNNYYSSIQKVKTKILNLIRAPIVEYFNGTNIQNPTDWFNKTKDLFLNIVIVEYKPIHDEIMFKHKELADIIRCNAKLIHNVHLIWIGD